MNKEKVDRLIGKAYNAINECGLLDTDGKLDAAFRGQIASFGAALQNGGPLAAIAFFCKGKKEPEGAKGKGPAEKKGDAKEKDRAEGNSDAKGKDNAKGKNNTLDEREKLLECIYMTCTGTKPEHPTCLFFAVQENTLQKDQGNKLQKEDIIHAAVAIKLAMNLFPLKRKEEQNGQKQFGRQ